tara:strand:+ start:1730 stop:2689 length:960 start_codon:yes stop_codon:yes gene_type:complete
MSNLVPTNIQIPAHLAGKVGQPSSLAQSLTGGLTSGEGSGFAKISIKGSRFRIVEDGTETVLDTTKLPVVIVGANPKLSKTYYAKAWDKDAEASAPDCYSLDGTSPHPDSETPQNDVCAACQWNAWGSKTGNNGQQLKACADQKRLAVVAADDPTGKVYLLQVTPAALKGLNAYQKELSTRGIPPEIVKTVVSFDTDASFPKLLFGFGGFIDETTQSALENVFGSEQVKEITGEVLPAIPPVITETKNPKPVLVKATPEPAGKEAKTTHGFGSGQTQAAKIEAPAAREEEPKAAKVVDADVGNLASEIDDLLGDLGADD